jgi:hypothetical protein
MYFRAIEARTRRRCVLTAHPTTISAAPLRQTRQGNSNYPRVFLKHDIVHRPFKDLLHREAPLSRQVEKCQILLQQPGSIWREEDQGSRVSTFLHELLNARDQLPVLGVIEQNIREDENVKARSSWGQERSQFLRCRSPQVSLVPLNDCSQKMIKLCGPQHVCHSVPATGRNSRY